MPFVRASLGVLPSVAETAGPSSYHCLLHLGYNPQRTLLQSFTSINNAPIPASFEAPNTIHTPFAPMDDGLSHRISPCDQEASSTTTQQVPRAPPPPTSTPMYPLHVPTSCATVPERSTHRTLRSNPDRRASPDLRSHRRECG
ncbi:hypothetical protein Rs2_39519 [Raphanus sativus]|nr:hypothetical protein Rs2_39519 [Raphanus sativus]